MGPPTVGLADSVTQQVQVVLTAAKSLVSDPKKDVVTYCTLMTAFEHPDSDRHARAVQDIVLVQ